MMIRSMPPASAQRAVIPVPAPPPTIGRPAATWARRRCKHCSRVKKLIRLIVSRNDESAPGSLVALLLGPPRLPGEDRLGALLARGTLGGAEVLLGQLLQGGVGRVGHRRLLV